MNEFDGPDYDASKDGERLRRQFLAVKRLMLDGGWRTLSMIATDLHYPEGSVSARLRDLRKEKFGSHVVEKRRVGHSGLWEYRVVAPDVSFDEGGQGSFFNPPARAMAGH